MRVLIVCVPQAGHVNPLLPLVSGFVAGGDEVLVASGSAVRDLVEGVGARFWPAGGDLQDWFARLGARTRGRPGDGLPANRIVHYFVPRLFAEVAADDMVEGALAAGKAFMPDVVVFDSEAFAGPLVAEHLGVPAVHHTIGPLLDLEVLQLATDAVSPLWRSFGRDVPAYAGLYLGTTVAVCPPSLERRSVPLGHLAYVRPAPLPRAPLERQSPPLVYFTMGTLWTDPGIVRTVLAALAEEPVEVLVTLGRLEPEALGLVPANVRVERYVPQAELLPRCSAVIHHAGAGTMFGVLAHGLPQVALPQAADNFVNAEILAAAGVARVVAPEDLDEDAVRAALREVLRQPSYRDAAAAIAGEVAAMPSPDQLCAELRARIGS